MNLEKFKLKFNSLKMKDIDKALDDIDYEKIKPKKIQKRIKPYEDKTNFKTIRESFLQAIDKYSNNVCILEKPSHKEAYKEITYKEFGDDVLSLRNSFNRKIKFKG